MVQLAHGQCAHQQVHVPGFHGFAAGGLIVLRWRHESDLRRVLTRGCLGGVFDEPHAQRTGHAHGFETRQRRRVRVDGLAQFLAGVANVRSVDEHGRNAGVDHGGLECADAGYLEVIHQIAGGEHRPAVTLFRRVHELHHDLGRGERHTIQFEVARLLHLPGRDGHMRNDGLLDVRLPDANDRDAVLRDACCIHQPHGDGARAHGRRQIAAVAAPVHESLVDGHLPVEIVHVVVRAGAGGKNDALGSGRRGAAHAVDVCGIRVRAADHALEQPVTCDTRHLRAGGQVLQAEERALAGAPAHINGGDTDLRYGGHGAWLRKRPESEPG